MLTIAHAVGISRRRHEQKHLLHNWSDCRYRDCPQGPRAVLRVCEMTQIFREGTRRAIRPCSREDSNLHGLPHTVLSRTRLPVPPREQKKRGLTMRGWKYACKLKSKRLA